MTETRTRNQRLNCTECGNQIQPGERRSPTPGGAAHDKCLKRGVATVVVKDDGEVTLEGPTRVTLHMFIDPDFSLGELLPEWLRTACLKRAVRPGEIGIITWFRDGHYEFELADELSEEDP